MKKLLSLFCAVLMLLMAVQIPAFAEGEVTLERLDLSRNQTEFSSAEGDSMTGTLQVYGVYSDGSVAKVTDGLTYASSDTSVVTVDASGNYNVLKKGMAQITVTCGEKSNSIVFVSSDLKFPFRDDEFSSISVEPNATATITREPDPLFPDETAAKISGNTFLAGGPNYTKQSYITGAWIYDDGVKADGAYFRFGFGETNTPGKRTNYYFQVGRAANTDPYKIICYNTKSPYNVTYSGGTSSSKQINTMTKGWHQAIAVVNYDGVSQTTIDFYWDGKLLDTATFTGTLLARAHFFHGKTLFKSSFVAEATATEAELAITGIKATVKDGATLEYKVGESFNKESITVKGILEDGTEGEEITTYTVSPSTFTTLGEQNVTISYNGLTATVAVTVLEPVVEPAITKLDLSRNQTEFSIAEGDELTGTIQVYGVYDTGAVEKITEGLTYASSDTSVVAVDANGNYTVLKKGMAKITVTCGEISNSMVFYCSDLLLTYRMNTADLPAYQETYVAPSDARFTQASDPVFSTLFPNDYAAILEKGDIQLLKSMNYAGTSYAIGAWVYDPGSTIGTSYFGFGEAAISASTGLPGTSNRYVRFGAIGTSGNNDKIRIVESGKTYFPDFDKTEKTISRGAAAWRQLMAYVNYDGETTKIDFYLDGAEFGYLQFTGTIVPWKLYFPYRTSTASARPIKGLFVAEAQNATATLAGIKAVAKDGASLTYKVGESFNKEDIVVKELYNNGTEGAEIADFTVTPESFTTAGEQDVTVKANGFTTTLKVNVIQITVNEIELAEAKANYLVGGSFEGKVIAHYSDGEVKEVTGYTVSPETFEEAGDKTVTVSFEGKSASLPVKVYEANAIEAELVDSTRKYKISTDTVLNNHVNVTAKATDANGTVLVERALSTKEFTLTGKKNNFDKSNAEYTIGVSYGSLTTTFTITTKTLVGLKVEKAREEEAYVFDLGKQIALSYYNIYAIYDDGTTDTSKLTSHCKFSPSPFDVAGDAIEVTVTVAGEVTASVGTVKVKEPEVITVAEALEVTNANQVVKVVGYYAGVSRAKATDANGNVISKVYELILKDKNSDKFITVRSDQCNPNNKATGPAYYKIYGEFPNFGYTKGDEIVLIGYVMDDSTIYDGYNAGKKFLSFATKVNPDNIESTIISRGNTLTYDFSEENVVEINNWADMQAKFAEGAIAPYTYIKLSGLMFQDCVIKADGMTEYRLHMNPDATAENDGIFVQEYKGVKRAVALSGSALASNVGANWSKKIFGVQCLVTTAIPGSDFGNEFYAMYIGGDQEYQRLVILDEAWILGNASDNIKVDANNNISFVSANAGDYRVVITQYENDKIKNIEIIDVTATEALTETAVTRTKDFSLDAGTKIMLFKNDLTTMLPYSTAFVK